MIDNLGWKPKECVLDVKELVGLYIKMSADDVRIVLAACTSLDEYMLNNMEDYRESQKKDT